jgi:hypothetical protein
MAPVAAEDSTGKPSATEIGITGILEILSLG